MTTFWEKWRDSHAYVDFALDWLDAHFNVQCEKSAQRYRPRYEDRASYKDAGDLIVIGSGQVIEVKSKRDVFFTSPADFPFGSVMIENVEAYRPRRATLVISGDCRALTVVPDRLKGQFFIRTVNDRHINREFAKYLCPKHLSQWYLADGTMTHEGDRPMCCRCRKTARDTRQHVVTRGSDRVVSRWVRLRPIHSPAGTSLHICDSCDDGTFQEHRPPERTAPERQPDHRDRRSRGHQAGDLFAAVRGAGRGDFSEAGTTD